MQDAPKTPEAPGFPVGLDGLGELHAVPAGRDRTRGDGWRCAVGNPGTNPRLRRRFVLYLGAEVGTGFRCQHFETSDLPISRKSYLTTVFR
jgi:hypothetical protein